jgi:hypothetical protein
MHPFFRPRQPLQRREFQIKNVSGRTMRIGLSSDLPDRVAFQLTNENLVNAAKSLKKGQVPCEHTGVTFCISTSVVQEADFNQVFNLVGHINEVEMAPGQSRSLVGAYSSTVIFHCDHTPRPLGAEL